MQKLLWLVLLTLAVWACSNSFELPNLQDGTSEFYAADQRPFYHGVASGDPLSDRVVIWTRVTPDRPDQSVAVDWEVSRTPDFKVLLRFGTAKAKPERDFTVKVDVDELPAGEILYYRFKALKTSSPVGRTRTLPEDGMDPIHLAVVSCSNYEAGYFAAFRHIAGKDSLHAVLHLGDYLYEYAPKKYGDPSLGRFHLPPREITSLQDYRTRYAQYRLDPDFQKAHQMHPFITIWDDHEIANNAYMTGAQNHQPEEEGDYEARKAVARQAYYEWMPIREQKQLYRAFSFNDNVRLIMLDERLAGRTQQLESVDNPDYKSSDRGIIGKKQLAWFKKQLDKQPEGWNVVGNQVIFSELNFLGIRPGWNRNLDAWDGYPYEQNQVIEHLKDNQLPGVIFVTGDTHASWAFEVPESLRSYLVQGQASVVAHEFGTTSVSSPNWDERASVDTVKMAEAFLMGPNQNPHLKYVNLRDHGYLVLNLYSDNARAQWFFLDNVKDPESGEFLGREIRLRKGDPALEAVSGGGQ